jgi:hypothetical protein
MDMDGNIRHRWQLDFLTAFPDYPRQWLDPKDLRFWLERSEFRGLWTPDLDAFEGDLFHTNSLFVLDGSLSDRLPAFRPGPTT